MVSFRVAITALLVIASVLPHASMADERLRKEAGELFGPLKAPPLAVTAGLEQELGRELFWDARMSVDIATACASCHPATDWGADRRRGVLRRT